MTIINTCCCCNLRIGAFACGIYTAILSLVTSGLSGYNLYHIQFFDLTRVEDETEKQMWEGIEAWCYATLALCSLTFLASLLHIVGVHKDQRFLFLPWMCMMVLVILVDAISVVYGIFTYDNVEVTFSIIHSILWLIFTLISMYCLLCVISQYQELAAGRGTAADYRHPAVIYESSINEVMIAPGPVIIYPHHGAYSAVPTQPGEEPPHYQDEDEEKEGTSSAEALLNDDNFPSSQEHLVAQSKKKSRR
ncbi:uncharacterized protein LOC106167918 [Lingula anatina]|uniref:Uncharacterized protein LOC106167918 n=1 Tax=Lingula anatina TaxID=7574 RepID=A0A1S3IVP7_LINAN|nr:uncharacterized protein LOC106167918 [Lingula anatina]|eukprot:XP_013402267.1 uncharacterized protein LOC106167918 [Lingula anatina]